MSEMSPGKSKTFTEETERLKGLVQKLKRSHHELLERSRLKEELSDTNLSQKMAELILITNQLSMTTNLDDMCKAAVELGRQRFGFPRIGIWLIDREDESFMRGTFGTDPEGNTRDERGCRLETEEESLLISARQKLVPGIVFFDDIALKDLNGHWEVEGCQRLFSAVGDGEKVIGHISADNFPSRKPFTEDHKKIFGFFASVLGPLLSNRMAREELAGRNEHLSILNEVGRMVAGSISPREIAERLLDILRKKLPCDAFFLSHYDSFANSLLAICAYDTVDGILRSFPPKRTYYSPKGVIAQVIRSREPIIIHREDPNKDSEGFTRAGDIGRPSASLLYVPMISGNEIIAFLSVQSYTPNAYKKSHAELLCQVANQTAPALEASILNQTIRERAKNESQLNERLVKLVQVTNELAGQESLEELSRNAVRLARQSLDFDSCRIVFHSEDNSEFVESSWSIGESGEMVDERGRKYPLISESIRGKVLLNEFPSTLTEELGDSEVSETIPMYMVSAIWDGTRVIGAVEVQCDCQDNLTRVNQVEVLRLFASSYGVLHSFKRSERARERSERIYREVIEKSSGVPYRFRFGDRAYEFVGHGIEHLLGVKPKDFTMPLAEKMVKEIVVADLSVDCKYDQYTRRFKAGEIPQYQVDILMETLLGEEKWIHDTAVLLKNEAGEPVGTLGILQDITGRKKQELQIRQAHDIYCRAIARAQGVPYRLNLLTGQYDFVGEGCLDLVGVPASELSQDKFREIILEEGPTDSHLYRNLTEMRTAFRRGEIDHYKADMLLRLHSGEEKWISDVSVGIRDEKTGEIVATLGILQNISDRKRIEMQLERNARELARSNSELEHFAYIASHDLREPLRKIASFTELLANKYRGQLDEAAEKYIWYIVDGANRMHNLIDDLLTYSRLGRTELVRNTISLDEVLDRTLSDLEHVIQHSGAIIERSTMPTVFANSAQIGQVFQNLVANAVKFCDNLHPIISISAQELDKEWCISVQDNGIGIDEQYLDRIFKVFQRLHPVGKYPGTGIGLAICKKIIERHGGRVWVESEPGVGSIFHFTIPKTTEE